MRKEIYTIFLIVLLLTCSVVLVSCDAITSQNITDNGGAGVGPGGNPGRNGGPGR
jgi:hypothetical protein